MDRLMDTLGWFGYQSQNFCLQKKILSTNFIQMANTFQKIKNSQLFLENVVIHNIL